MKIKDIRGRVAKQGLLKMSVFAWLELEGHTVDAKPLSCGCRSIRKHMAKMSFTLQHREAFITPSGNRALYIELDR